METKANISFDKESLLISGEVICCFDADEYHSFFHSKDISAEGVMENGDKVIITWSYVDGQNPKLESIKKIKNKG